MKREAYIPNLEVAQIISSTIADSGWGFASDTLRRSQELLNVTWDLDEKKSTYPFR